MLTKQLVGGTRLALIVKATHRITMKQFRATTNMTYSKNLQYLGILFTTQYLFITIYIAKYHEMISAYNHYRYKLSIIIEDYNLLLLVDWLQI